jgi:type IV secretion system protein VirB8
VRGTLGGDKPAAAEAGNGSARAGAEIHTPQHRENAMKRDPALQAYFEEAAVWDADRTARARRSERTAWWVAGAGWAGVVLLALALMLLMPLKRVEPFVIRVDRSTGIVNVVPVYAGTDTFPDTVTRYFLDHYMTVCERFDFATAESDYEECGAFNTPRLNQAWYAEWVKTNPDSPLNRYKDGTSVSAEVISISFFTGGSGVRDLAQVRYAKVIHAAGGSAAQRSYWIATIQYAYTKPSSDPRTREWNPLGFRVVDFHTDPEIHPDAGSQGSSTAAAPGHGGAS